MRKRIAVVGGKDKALAALRAEAEAADTDLFAMAPGAPLPPGTGAVLATDWASGLAPALRACRDHETVLLLLSEAIGAREGHVAGSARRVLDHATRMAAALGLEAGERSQLERAALLRAVGKLRISNEVLLKKSVLDYDEWLQIQQHPAMGAALLKELDLFADVAEIVEAHHEYYDGTGYPHKLERDAIPRLARALNLLDVYCAMTSPRHYRSGHATHAQGVEHLKSERGKHFDPAMVDAFIEHEVGRDLEPAEG
jgi:HD-GYP domain-containing protein (c-di-GMP phosphodiesterase class II)